MERSAGYVEQKTFWDAVDERRPPHHPAVEAFSHPKVDFVCETLGAAPGALSMLEIGAGNGFFSDRLRHAFALSVLDFSHNMLVRNEVPSPKIVGDAARLPCADDAFDVLFCANLLHHLDAPVAAVREMARVARRHVVLVEPNALNPLMALFGLVVRRERGTLRFTPGYLKGLGREAGLALRRFSTQGMIVPNKTPEPALPLLRRVDRPSPAGFYHVAIFDV